MAWKLPAPAASTEWAASVKGATARLLKPKVKGAWAYSQACTQENEMPSSTVFTRPLIAPLGSPGWLAVCAQVSVVPEVSRIRVLSSGKCHGSSVLFLFGGLLVLFSLLWLLVVLFFVFF